MADDMNASGTPAATDSQEQRSTTDSSASGAATSQTTDEIKNPEAKRHADEAAALRVANKQMVAELQQFRTKQKADEDAKLTADEKRERDFAELKAQAEGYKSQLRKQELHLAGYRLRDSLGIGDISAALALIDAEHASEVKYGADDGKPENLETLLKAVLKDHPSLAASTARPAPSSGAAMNPARGTVQQSGDQTLGRHIRLGNLGVFQSGNNQ